jgi:HEPN domain-containing protein
MKQYEILLKKARVDFHAAENLYHDISSGDVELDYEVVLFHLHQSAEKYLKSLLAFNSIDYPKVHDLELLARLCEENNVASELDIEILIELSDFAVEGRYSFIYEDVDNIEQYFAVLKKVLGNNAQDT